MRTTTRERARRSCVLTIDISPGRCAGILDEDSDSVLGHRINRTRRRYLDQAEWIVAKDDQRPLGLAAYHRIESNVRLTLEFLLDPALSAPAAVDVTDLLLEIAERRAIADGISCLMFMLEPEVSLGPFLERRYVTVASDSAGAWVQKTICSVRPGQTALRRWH